jgi:DNA primase
MCPGARQGRTASFRQHRQRPGSRRRKLVRLTNLRKPFWPALGITKGDLLRYYAAIAPALVPHIRSRPRS